MTSLRVLEYAELELEHAAFTYQRERPGWGDKFMDEYVAMMAIALRMPQSGMLLRKRGDEEIRRFLFKRFPYSVIAVLRQDVLFVVAVPHQRQRPWYWAKRLAKVRP